MIIAALLLIIATATMLYHACRRATFIVVLFALHMALTLLGLSNLWLWATFIVLITLIAYPPLRQYLFIRPFIKPLTQAVPSLSSTEKEALEAGTTWWEAELFRGKPHWHTLLHYPTPKLTEEEQTFINGPVASVCAMVDDFDVTHRSADLPQEVWAYLKENKFFALIIDKQYGGLKFSPYAQSCILQKLASVSSTLAITVGVPNSLGPGELLQHYGTEEQKNYYLPRLAKGEEIPCFALTSPEAGSDASAIPDVGEVCWGEWQGETILGMRLTWNKRYITLAPVATLLGLAFKLRDPEHLLGETTELGITCALIPTHTPGVEIGRRHFPLNVPFQNGPTKGKDVFVPLDFIIGGQAMAGKGWMMLMSCLSIGRGITLPSNSTGMLINATLTTSAYARIRRQFKQPIGKMEGIERPLAEMIGTSYVLDAACRLTMGSLMLGEKPAIVSAIMKYHSTERAQHAIKLAMDITGGKGICLGPSNFIARAYQGAPVAITVEGANILTRSMIIFGQGAIRCHPYLIQMVELLAKKEVSVSELDQLLTRFANYSLGNSVRAFWLSFTAGFTSKAPHKSPLQRYYQYCNLYSAQLALLSDTSLLLLGGQLKRKEAISARLGDILSVLYLCSAILKQQHDSDYQHTHVAKFALDSLLKEIEISVSELLDNYPNVMLGWGLKRLLMPFGLRWKVPSDIACHHLALQMQKPSSLRDYFTNAIDLQATSTSASAKVNHALQIMIDIEPILEKIANNSGRPARYNFLDKQGKEGVENGWISQDEYQRLILAEKVRLSVINVDDFAPDEIAHS